MNFIDKATVSISAGDGGRGAVSFRHEKFIDRGGPDGGDGGNGGSVVFLASRSQNTLASFRYQKELKAKPGQAGSKTRRHGRTAGDLIVAVPVGTVVLNEDGEVLADLADDEQTAVIAKGGRGGFGNAHFISSTRQAPNFAEIGEPGEELTAVLELKMIADVGLVGLPNAGKSTLLATISNARPEIADYPFTTLRPNLGVVDIDQGTSVLFADIPGLIEGASLGKGLGHEFLRHVERTKVLVHLVDAYQDDLAAAYKTIQDELKSYKVDLTDRPQIIALNKTEGLDKKTVDGLLKTLKKVAPKNAQLFAISAQAGTGVKEMLFALKDTLTVRQAEIAEEAASDIPVLKITGEDKSWQVTKDGKSYVVTGFRIEKFAARTDFGNEQGVRRLRDIMKKMGIMHELRRQKIDAGQKVKVGKYGSFEY
jgi:GTP-binding protein